MLHLQNIWGCLPFTKIFEVVFHYKNIQGRLPITKLFEVVFKYTYWTYIHNKLFEVTIQLQEYFKVVFHLQKYLRSSSIYKIVWGRLPFTKIFEVVFHLQKYLIKVVFYFLKNCGRLPYPEKLKIEVVFHFLKN
jgi:hypothetical protein